MPSNPQHTPAEINALAQEHGIDLEALELTVTDLEVLAAAGDKGNRNPGQWPGQRPGQWPGRGPGQRPGPMGP